MSKEAEIQAVLEVTDRHGITNAEIFDAPKVVEILDEHDAERAIKGLVLLGYNLQQIAEHLDMGVNEVSSQFGHVLKQTREIRLAMFHSRLYDLAESGENPALTAYYDKEHGLKQNVIEVEDPRTKLLDVPPDETPDQWLERQQRTSEEQEERAAKLAELVFSD